MFFYFIDDHDVLSFLLFRLTEPGQQQVPDLSRYYPAPSKLGDES